MAWFCVQVRFPKASASECIAVAADSPWEADAKASAVGALLTPCPTYKIDAYGLKLCNRVIENGKMRFN